MRLLDLRARRRRMGAERQRRARARRAQGMVVYRVALDEHALAAALLASGRLGEAAALDRGEVETALAEVLRAWCGRWLRDFANG